MRRMRVAVLMGGPSPERDVSLATGRQIAAALDHTRYDVLPVEITVDGKWLLRPDLALPAPAQRSGIPASTATTALTAADGIHSPVPLSFEVAVERERVDVAFIAMHGPYGEDGTVQGLLELLGLPYTGSGVLASALAMDKLRSRQLFAWHRIPVPTYLSVTSEEWQDHASVHQRVAHELGYPCVVKPNAVGSSIGVSLVRDPAQLDRAVDVALAYGSLVLIEEYLRGTELTCGIIDDPQTGHPVALPLIEVVPHAEFYDYQAKYATGGSDHFVPARVSETLTQSATALALRAYQALGCEGMSRVDMIARGDQIVVLEINTIPGMTATSLLPDAAKAAGISFAQLLDRIVACALRRTSRRATKPPSRASAP
ncbi:MAG TPA: D-alanine--D-alanine ligase [bacterium]|nr:D-alanine--D-alanine ligase [bacterium]